MRRYGAWLLCALVCGASSSARAENGTPVRATSPFTVRGVFGVATLGATFNHREGDGIAAPTNPSCTVRVGMHARDAYSGVIRSLFEPTVNAESDAELEVSIKAVDVESRGGVWRAVVEHAVALNPVKRSFEPLRLNVRAEELIVGTDERALVNAFARAADAAAAKFEQAFEANPPAGWARPIDRTAAIRVQERVYDGPVTFLNVGVGSVAGGDGRGPGFFARGGIIADWLVMQVSAGQWITSFRPSSPNPDVNLTDVQLDTWAVGLEVAAALRKRGFDLRAGGGGHVLRGHANQSYRPDPSTFGSDTRVETSFAFLRVVPSVFGSVQYAGELASGRLRLYLGLEARGYFGATADFAEYGRGASVAENSLLLYGGVEVPWGWRPARPVGGPK